MLSSEYGWSTEYILKRTLWEMNWRIEAIINRLNLKGRFEMAIHGIKPDSSNSDEPKNIKLTKDQEKAMEIARKRAMERKRVEFLERSKNG